MFCLSDHMEFSRDPFLLAIRTHMLHESQGLRRFSQDSADKGQVCVGRAECGQGPSTVPRDPQKAATEKTETPHAAVGCQ